MSWYITDRSELQRKHIHYIGTDCSGTQSVLPQRLLLKQTKTSPNVADGVAVEIK